MAHAQADNAVREGALRVFLDCNARNCNSTYFRTEIDWVSWVRDRTLAQVHLIMTSETTASGGLLYRFDFVGLEDLEGSDDGLTYRSLGTDTTEEVLLGISRVIAVGLARYSVLVGAGEGIEVKRSGSQRDIPQGLVSGDQVQDPWDFWIFNVGASGSYFGQSTQTFWAIGSNFTASRTTLTWKVRTSFRGSFSRNTVERNDGTELVDDRTNWSANQLVVYATADHWSIGVEVEADASTRNNQDLGIDVLPALEFSLFPYEEATRRSLTAMYQVGANYFDFEEETIFGKATETRPAQELTISLFKRQTWGNAGVSVRYNSFLDNLGQNRFEVEGNLRFRVTRGLQLNVNGEFRRLRDQIFLPAGGVTDEEILLASRARASTFEAFVSLGFSYQFGSIFNNVVNNRF